MPFLSEKSIDEGSPSQQRQERRDDTLTELRKNSVYGEARIIVSLYVVLALVVPIGAWMLVPQLQENGLFIPASIAHFVFTILARAIAYAVFDMADVAIARSVAAGKK